MTVLSAPPRQPQASGGDGPAASRASFETQLTRALASCGSGRPHALLKLGFARAPDIHRRCGREGVQALRGQVFEALPARLAGPRRDALLESEPCEISLLLRDCDARQAEGAAQRMRRAVDRMVFRWQTSPFRLGVHVGVLELGPHPAMPGLWLERADEACRLAGELGGDGLELVRYDDHAWSEISQEREWRDHLSEVLC